MQTVYLSADVSVALGHKQIQKAVDYLEIRTLIDVYCTQLPDILRASLRTSIEYAAVTDLEQLLWNGLLLVLLETF